jgi:hypothetical protein
MFSLSLPKVRFFCQAGALSLSLLTLGIAPAFASPDVLLSDRLSAVSVSTPELPSLDTTAYLPEAEDTVHVVLRLSERQVYVYKGKEAIASYPVAIGRPDTPTPTGEFQIFEMLENPSWQNPRTGEVEPAGPNGSLGTRWMAFSNQPNGVIGFHGTPNRASIGRAASHGCVRMRDEDAVALYSLIQLGTVVTVEP